MTTKRGFILGKFMPVHAGHLFLCDVASDLVDELTVLVCSRDSEPIDGQARLTWVRQSVKPNVKVLHLHREMPQEPGDHPHFWALWKNVIRELLPEPIDTVFGSEEYIIRLAAELDAKPFILDATRRIVPVSASDIRLDPPEYWQFIPPAVRSFYQQRVCILGPESTGKSRLSEWLAEVFATRSVPEYGRTYDAWFRKGVDWALEDFLQIISGHRALRRQIAERAGYVYFEDTDLLQTIVWAEYLLGSVPEALGNLLQDWQPAQFYLLLKPDVPWRNDGTRYSGEAKVRSWFFDRLETLLSDMALPFNVIEGRDWHSRENAARAAITEFMGGVPS